jgi:hypothetical protein
MSSVPETNEVLANEPNIITIYYGIFWFVVFLIFVMVTVGYHLYWTSSKRANKYRYGNLV